MVSDFSAGKIVGDSFQILVKRFVTIFTIAFLCGIPQHIVTVRDAMRPREATREADQAAQLKSVQDNAPLYLIILIVSPLASGALAFAVYQHLRGRHASVAECLGVALRRFLPLLGVAICSGLFVAAGFLLLIVGAFVFATMVYVASAACVVEKQGVFASMRRSRELTKGYRWRIFVVMFGVNILLGIFGFIVGMGIAVADSKTLLAGVQVFLQTISIAWNGSAAALSYYHLRSIKDSVDVEDVAAVFD